MKHELPREGTINIPKKLKIMVEKRMNVSDAEETPRRSVSFSGEKRRHQKGS